MLGQKSIGGFFELEQSGKEINFHKQAHALSNGRTCLNAIVKYAKPDNIYIPYYCCDTLLASLYLNNTKFTFYPINERLEPASLPALGKNEFFLYINYFGLKNNMVKELINQYKSQIIIDNVHAYFEKGYESGWSFNSARKFFGVPDGAYLYAPSPIEMPKRKNKNFITEHLTMRKKGNVEEGFKYYQRNEAIQNCDLFLISDFSTEILEKLDYSSIGERRKINFNLYRKYFRHSDNLAGIDVENGSVPFCYPLLTGKEIDHTIFYNQKIYIPNMWNEVKSRNREGYSWEKKIASCMLILPVDHRYDEGDLIRIIELVKQIIK